MLPGVFVVILFFPLRLPYFSEIERTDWLRNSGHAERKAISVARLRTRDDAYHTVVSELTFLAFDHMTVPSA